MRPTARKSIAHERRVASGLNFACWLVAPVQVVALLDRFLVRHTLELHAGYKLYVYLELMSGHIEFCSHFVTVSSECRFVIPECTGRVGIQGSVAQTYPSLQFRATWEDEGQHGNSREEGSGNAVVSTFQTPTPIVKAAGCLVLSSSAFVFP